MTEFEFDKKIVSCLGELDNIPFKIVGSSVQELQTGLINYGQVASKILAKSFPFVQNDQGTYLQFVLSNPLIRKSRNETVTFLDFPSGGTIPYLQNNIIRGIKYIKVNVEVNLSDTLWTSLGTRGLLDTILNEENQELDSIRQKIYGVLNANWKNSSLPIIKETLHHELTHVGQFENLLGQNISTIETYKPNSTDESYYYSKGELPAHAAQMAEILRQNHITKLDKSTIRPLMVANFDKHAVQYYLDTNNEYSKKFWDYVKSYLQNEPQDNNISYETILEQATFSLPIKQGNLFPKMAFQALQQIFIPLNQSLNNKLKPTVVVSKGNDNIITFSNLDPNNHNELQVQVSFALHPVFYDALVKIGIIQNFMNRDVIDPKLQAFLSKLFDGFNKKWPQSLQQLRELIENYLEVPQGTNHP